MRTLHAILLAAIAFVLASADAHAYQSSHERAAASPIMKNGEVVGMRIKLTLRPNERERNLVRIGLGPITLASTSVGGGTAEYRGQASDVSKGYLVHQWPEVKIEENELAKPKEITLEVLFKDAPNLVPGSKVEVITAWHSDKPNGASYWHIWGLQAVNPDASSVLVVPGTPKPAAATAAVHAVPARLRVTPKKATRAPTPRRMPAAARTRSAR
jgi:hypothetical protein